MSGNTFNKTQVTKDIIFCDCFNTLLFRICPDDEVIIRWIKELSIEYQLSYEKVKDVWKSSRKIVFQRLESDVEEPTFETLCKELYLRLKIYLHLSDDIAFLDFYENSLSKMEQIEKAVLVVNYELIEQLRELDKKVYCVSDFYLPQKSIISLFSYFKIDDVFSGFYISSDIGLRKSSGKLYNYVISDLGVSKSDVLMIGDNLISDYKNPKKLGISSIRYLLPCCKKDYNFLLTNFIEIYTTNNKNKSPFSNYCFSLYLFCKNLYKMLEKTRQNTVYFFSREGESLKKFFDEFLEINHIDNIDTKYLYVSRQSTFLPSLSSLKEENFEVLRRQFNSISGNDFLLNLGLLEKGHNALLKDYPNDNILAKLEVKQINFWTSDIYYKIKQSPSFEQVFNFEKSKVKSSFISYLNNCGINEHTKSFAIVDIGWKGSIQDNISSILGNEYTIYGYYYGLVGDVKISPSNRKFGLVFSDLPFQSKFFNIYSVNYRMLERVLYASHGSCLSYNNSEPILDDFSGKEKKLFNYVEQIQDNILENLKVINKNEGQTKIPLLFFDYALALLHGMFVLNLSYEKYKQIRFMDCSQKMNFGDFGKSGKQRKNLIKLIYQLLRRSNLLEMSNKIQNFLISMHLIFISYVIKNISLKVFIKRNRLWKRNKLAKM